MYVLVFVFDNTSLISIPKNFLHTDECTYINCIIFLLTDGKDAFNSTCLIEW